MAIEDLIANEGVIITLTHAALIKRTNISSYRAQRRGGRGVIGMTTREGDKPEDDDFVEHLFTASTHDYLMFFTNTGRVYVERVHEIPDGSARLQGPLHRQSARDAPRRERSPRSSASSRARTPRARMSPGPSKTSYSSPPSRAR